MIDSTTIDCPEHGEQQETFVCQHLATSLKTKKVVGYFCSTETSDNPRPDAWCIDCEELVQEKGGWDEESEKFAGITLLCGCCYDNAKKINNVFK